MPAKRGRVSSSPGVSNKYAKKVQTISAVIVDSEAYEESVKKLLTSMLPGSLPIYAEDRHSFQTAAVKMAGEALAAVKAEKEGTVASLKSTVDGVDQEKAVRTAATESAATAKTTLEAAETAAKATLDADKSAAAAATESAATAKTTLTEHGKAVVDAELKLADLKAAFSEGFEPFKEAKAGARPVAKMAKTLLACGADKGLADAVQETLQKDKEARGSFDGLVIEQVELALKKYTEEATAALAGSEKTKAELTSALEAAEAAKQAAADKKEASATALSEAVAARKAGEADLAAAHKSLASLDSEVAKATKDLEGAKKALATFEEGALAYYAELKDLAPPPPPPAVEEPAPAVEETAAPA